MTVWIYAVVSAPEYFHAHHNALLIMEEYNYKALTKEYLTKLGEILEKHGFKFHSSSRTYRRKFPLGRQSIGISLVAKSYQEFETMIFAGIRFDTAETFVHEDEADMANSIKIIGTMGIELGNYSIGENLTWDIASSHDIDRALSSIVEAIEKIGLPYLEKYSTMESAFEAYYNVEKHVNALDEFRFMRMISLAYFLGKYDMIESLIENSEKILREKYDFGLPRFRRFAEKVRGKVAEETAARAAVKAGSR